jgi:hypothetical protein
VCDASHVAPDWVVKGFHIHVNGIELQVFPDHRGSISFRAMFAETSEYAASTAIRIAIEDCLSNPEVRRAWIKSLERAWVFMTSVQGTFESRANGRMFEFKMTILAIQRWGT